MRCPDCKGELKFDGKIRKLLCLKCGSTFTRDEVDDYWDEKQYENAKKNWYFTDNEKTANELMKKK
jgi:predicted amidophosphoribosyltransferase